MFESSWPRSRMNDASATVNVSANEQPEVAGPEPGPACVKGRRVAVNASATITQRSSRCATLNQRCIHVA